MGFLGLGFAGFAAFGFAALGFAKGFAAGFTRFAPRGFAFAPKKFAPKKIAKGFARFAGFFLKRFTKRFARAANLAAFFAVFALFLAPFFAACDSEKSAQNPAQNPAQNSKIAPPKKETYKLESLDGKSLTFKRRGDVLENVKDPQKPYFLVFLSTWCVDCLGYAQHLENLHRDLGDGVNLYGIFVDRFEERATLERFVADSKATFAWFYKGDIAQLLGYKNVQNFPYALLYDKNGQLFMSYEGITPEEMIAFDMKKLL